MKKRRFIVCLLLALFVGVAVHIGMFLATGDEFESVLSYGTTPCYSEAAYRRLTWLLREVTSELTNRPAPIFYFVDYGTLLGIARYGAITPYDTDVDLSVNVWHIPFVQSAVSRILERNGGDELCGNSAKIWLVVGNGSSPHPPRLDKINHNAPRESSDDCLRRMRARHGDAQVVTLDFMRWNLTADAHTGHAVRWDRPVGEENLLPNNNFFARREQFPAERAAPTALATMRVADVDGVATFNVSVPARPRHFLRHYRYPNTYKHRISYQPRCLAARLVAPPAWAQRIFDRERALDDDDDD